MSSSDPLGNARMLLLQHKDDERALGARFYFPGSGGGAASPLDASLPLSVHGITAGSIVYYRLGDGEAEDFGDAGIGRGVEKGFTGSRFASSKPSPPVAAAAAAAAAPSAAGAGAAAAAASSEGSGVVEEHQLPSPTGEGGKAEGGGGEKKPSAGRGSRGGKAASGWTCPKCTFANSDVAKCQMCDQARGKK